ncbi:toprim domain-containing protein [Hymenobacter edaphi]|uniref:Toprim domain-containing protein n=1 Tax=Hymenobacter edaphi TaxID=2211146 RepID=A0A328B732_9BACT|nr:toprim domain-containing protein [Hymenobacter edaphi]RAK62445.1 hypothetical protein DLM85_23875 [Hymenobacter edaphi]
MNAPRENDPTELDRFKRDIDLVDYAQRQGYTIKKESRRGDWHHLVKDDEHVIVTRKGDHQVYLNTGDDRDAGSIIDFAKTRGGNGHGLNLGQVRQQLREYLDGAPAPARQYPTQYATPPDAARLSILPVGDPEQARQAEEERRTRLISEVLGVKKELTDRSYLHGRGITDETLDSPAFQGRIFTAQQNEHKNIAFPLYNEHGLASVEQKNEHYKSLLPLPKNGIWVSHPTDGKDTPVERVVVSESAIDSLSHFQLRHGQDPKNTLYIATSGTPTEAQVALIQRVIDKQQPREVVLANDRDAGGRQFNINYLNELQSARPMVPVAEQEAYREASRPVEWHATSDKYHTSLKVTFHHDSAEQGAGQVQQLSERVERINQTQQDGPSLAVEVQRSTEQATIVRLTVARADTAQLEVVAQELYRQREQLRPEAERQQEGFLRVDYPLAKDFNKELEYTNQGLGAEQIRAAAQREEQQRESERQQRLAEAQHQEREQRALEREAQRQRESSPEAQQERARDDKRFNQAVLGAATTEELQRPTRSYRTEQEAAEHTAQFVHARDAGLVLLKEYIHDNPPPAGRKVDEAERQELRDQARFEAAAVAVSLPAATPTEVRTATWKIDKLEPNSTGRAEAWKAILDNSGYSMRTSEVRSTVDEQGIRRAEFDMRYRNDQPDIAIIHAIVTNTNARAEAGKEQYAGVRVIEPEADRSARQLAAEAATIQPHNRDRSLDVTAKPGAEASAAGKQEVSAGPAGREKQVIIRVDEPVTAAGERGQAEAVQAAITASGAKAGELQSTVDEQGVRHSEMKVSYRTDQPEIAQISQALDAVAQQPGNRMLEHGSDQAERQQAAHQSQVSKQATQELER